MRQPSLTSWLLLGFCRKRATAPLLQDQPCMQRHEWCFSWQAHLACLSVMFNHRQLISGQHLLGQTHPAADRHLLKNGLALLDVVGNLHSTEHALSSAALAPQLYAPESPAARGLHPAVRQFGHALMPQQRK